MFVFGLNPKSNKNNKRKWNKINTKWKQSTDVKIWFTQIFNTLLNSQGFLHGFINASRLRIIFILKLLKNVFIVLRFISMFSNSKHPNCSHYFSDKVLALRSITGANKGGKSSPNLLLFKVFFLRLNRMLCRT